MEQNTVSFIKLIASERIQQGGYISPHSIDEETEVKNN